MPTLPNWNARYTASRPTTLPSPLSPIQMSSERPSETGPEATSSGLIAVRPISIAQANVAVEPISRLARAEHSAATAQANAAPRPPRTRSMRARDLVERAVPGPDRRRGSLVTGHADAGRLQPEMRPHGRRQPAPSGGEDARQVTVPEYEHVAIGGPDPFDHSVHPGSRRGHRLAARQGAGPYRPAGYLALNVGRGPALVVAVAQLAQVGHQLRLVESGQLRGAASAAQRAGQDQREHPAREREAQLAGLTLPCLGQWEIGATRMPAGSAPFGLAVANQDDLGTCCHRRSSSQSGGACRWRSLGDPTATPRSHRSRTRSGVSPRSSARPAAWAPPTTTCPPNLRNAARAVLTTTGPRRARSPPKPLAWRSQATAGQR